MIEKASHNSEREASAELGVTHHRTRHADIESAQKESARPRNFVAIARTSQDIKDALRCSQEWKWMAADQRETLEVIATGMAMILNGQANKPQAWNEIAEQAAAIAERVGRK